MSNMTYCRFENTLYDLIDCKESLNDEVEDTELNCKKLLLKECYNILDEYMIYVDNDALDRVIDEMES